MPRTDHPPEMLRQLLEGAYDRIEVLEDELEKVEAINRRGGDALDNANTRMALLETDLQTSRSRGDRLAGIVRDIVNHPTTTRVDVQSKLIVALEIFDGRRP